MADTITVDEPADKDAYWAKLMADLEEKWGAKEWAYMTGVTDGN